MCNEAQRIQNFISHWQGHSVSELFPQQVMSRLQYDRVRPGHCLVCGRPLNHHEMWPSGRCPRCMCQTCYQREILNMVNYRCIVSGEGLSQDKIAAQQSNPREVENNIADGNARDYYTLLANKVIGTDMGFICDATYYDYYSARIPYVIFHDPNTIEAEFENLGYQPSNSLPTLYRSSLALPPPSSFVEFPFQRAPLREYEPVRPMYKGKKVRKIPFK